MVIVVLGGACVNLPLPLNTAVEVVKPWLKFKPCNVVVGVVIGLGVLPGFVTDDKFPIFDLCVVFCVCDVVTFCFCIFHCNCPLAWVVPAVAAGPIVRDNWIGKFLLPATSAAVVGACSL